MKIGAQHCQGHFAEAREQQGFGIVQCRIEGGINRLFDKTAGRLGPVADSENRGLPSAV